MLLNYWYQPGFGTQALLFRANKATWENAVMREQGLGPDRVRRLGSESCLWTGEATNYLDWPFCKEEKIGTHEILVNRWQTVLGSSGSKGRKLSKNILYAYITQNVLTPRTHKELSMRHSVKLFNRRWLKRIRERNFLISVKTTIHSIQGHISGSRWLPNRILANIWRGG